MYISQPFFLLQLHKELKPIYDVNLIKIRAIFFLFLSSSEPATKYTSDVYNWYNNSNLLVGTSSGQWSSAGLSNLHATPELYLCADGAKQQVIYGRDPHQTQ